MILDELNELLGGGNSYRFAGLMGALATRINGTPGYGQIHKPSIKMIGTYERLEGDQWRFTMHEGLRKVLEELKPEWLKPL